MKVPKPWLDECNKHHLFLILVESSCRGNVSRALGFTKVWIMLWKVHRRWKWMGENPYYFLWREIWCFNFSFQNYYEKWPCCYTVEPLLPCNPIIGLWSKIASNTFLRHWLLKYFALAKVAMVMVLGSMEDKHYFSTLSFMRSKLWNQLTTHFNLVVKMFAQNHYTLDTFPFGDVIKDWVNNKRSYVIDC